MSYNETEIEICQTVVITLIKKGSTSPELDDIS